MEGQSELEEDQLESDASSKEEDHAGVETVTPSTVPDGILKLKNSFGYDCKRLFNLCLIDSETLVFASGNLLHYYSIPRNEFTLRRTVFGGGVGFIIKNHIVEYNYLTIAENGRTPTIFIYRYPEHEIVSELKSGAASSYTCGVYSNNGKLICTLSGYPDYMATIWDWQKSSIVLRSKAYQNDVFCVVFSHFNSILLASCGLSHVQFWKMAQTFTGLKLKSSLGRFGKTDTCDIYAVYMLADEKVISGCEWGNMLVWEDGLIKLEVTRKARKACHTKPITRFIWMGNNELMTVGMDGYARIWFWETVELADPPEDDRFVEIDPMYEFRIGDKDETCESRHLLKARPFDDGDFEYYSQDGKGGVWTCDLNTVTTPKPSRKLFSCHGGRVVAGQASPVSTHIATLGEDGKLNIYNYISQELLTQEPFSAPGRDLLWLDTTIDRTGMVLILAFEDGVLRQVALEIDESKQHKVIVHIISAVRAHARPITCLGVSPSQDLLLSGALDNTVFLFHIKDGGSNFVEIVPLGFVLFDGSPTCFHWDKNKPRTVLLGCQTGEVYECDLSPPESVDLIRVRPTWRIYPLSRKMLKFKSVKSSIRRELQIAATLKRKAKKLRAKKKEMKRLMEINPGLQFDESALADSSEEDEEEKNKPLFVPDPPNPVLWLQYTDRGTIWLSMGGYDAGYVYEVKFGAEELVSCTLIPEGDDIEIHSYMYIDKFLIFGIHTGQIRINATKTDFRDLSDFWLISMHDNLNGVIPRIFTSHDGQWFFSIGHDGNIFHYQWNGPIIQHDCPPPEQFWPPSTIGNDIEDPDHLSLEQVKIEENLVKLHAFEQAERQRLQPSFVVMQLQIDWITDKSKDLCQSNLNAVLEKMELDVAGACRDAKELYDLMFLSLEYIPFEVFAIRTDMAVRVFRLPILRTESESVVEEIDEEESIETELDKNVTIGTGSITTLAESRSSQTPSTTTIIYDFPEKVLLKFYIRILEFFSTLKQIKTEELSRVMEIYGEECEFSEEGEQSLLGLEEDTMGEEEEQALEEEEITLIERAISFLNNSIRDTVEVKNLEISIILEISHTLKSDFNGKVIQLKIQKAQLYKRYGRLSQEIMKAGKSIELPSLRELVVYHEYPEEIFKEPFIPLRSFESILWEKPIEKIREQIADNLDEGEEDAKEEELLEEFQDCEGEEELFPEEKSSDDWVMDTENLVDKIYGRIQSLDDELSAIAISRVMYEVDTKYLDLILDISSQELMILQESELTEKDLVQRDETAKKQRQQIDIHIRRLKAEIEATLKVFEVMNEQIKAIYTEFYEAIRGNKFFKFLRRIFEKKFKPKRERGPDDETESESSTEESSSEEEARGTDDSGDMNAIHLDESHCPAGCDRKLYDLAFELRAQRYALEQKIFDDQKLNDSKRIEIQELNRKIPAADEFCTMEHTNLLLFRYQKDEKIRAVENEVIYDIEGFGMELNENQRGEESEKYLAYLETLLNEKRNQFSTLKEELRRPIETYTEKLRVLLEILEERDRLRRKKLSTVEITPSVSRVSEVPIARPPTPPPPFDFEAYASEKVLRLVQRFFVRYLAKHISEVYMRKYIPKVARCLANIGRNFTCELADNIIDVIVENLQRIVPKKYLIHASLDDIRSLFKDIVAVFELEPVEVNPVAVITQAVEKCIKNFIKARCANKTQRIILEVSKIIVDELPMDDFRSPETPKLVAKLLAREAVIIPNCFTIDVLVEQLLSFAREHMLSAVTVKIVSVFANDLLRELLEHKVAEVRSVKPRERVCRDMRRKKRVS